MSGVPSIERLFVSPGHNFRGRYGQEPLEHPLIEVDEVECVAGRGLRGDRYFDHAPDFKGQITFVARETLERLWAELAIPPERRDLAATRAEIEPLVRRAQERLVMDRIARRLIATADPVFFDPGLEAEWRKIQSGR